MDFHCCFPLFLMTDIISQLQSKLTAGISGGEEQEKLEARKLPKNALSPKTVAARFVGRTHRTQDLIPEKDSIIIIQILTQ